MAMTPGTYLYFNRYQFGSGRTGNRAILDLESVYHYHPVPNSLSGEEAQLQKELNDMFVEDTLAPVTMQTLREGFKSIEGEDYLGAVYSFQGALRRNPKDRRIREMLNYAEGLLEADMVRLLFVDDLPK